MFLKCFKEEFYDRLLDSIDGNVDHYGSESDWLSQYFETEDYFIPSSVQVEDFDLIKSDEDESNYEKNAKDLENAIRLHEAFKGINVLQATNRYMWTYLCHHEPFADYVRKRWLGNGGGNTTVRTRFFVTGSADSLFNDNALSRLWWYAHLTYDKTNTVDPYHLTRILLTNQTVCTDIMDTQNRKNLERMKGVLLAVKDVINIRGSNRISDVVRDCNKYLNRHAAFSVFEFLGSEDIRMMAKEYMLNNDRKNRV